MEFEDPYLLLAVAEGCGPGFVPKLLDPHADPQRLLSEPPELPPATAHRLLATAELAARARSWLVAAKRLGLHVLTPADDRYPDRLRQTPLRPLVLFARGDVGLLNRPLNHARDTRPALTIVGSRTPTAYGEAATRDFATTACLAGLSIWSGLAVGIDALAHQTAVRHRTPTVAVLAGGLDHIYPSCHEPLAEQIVAGGGLLVAEAPPGMRAQRGHFPRRNRILAGAADAVLIVEAGQCSGSLHTARFAADTGVPVFAVPGPYTSPRSRGCHDLIADGAHVAAAPDELLRRLGIEADASSAMEESADETAVVRLLQSGPRPADLVQRESGLPRDHFLRAVLTLTGRGHVDNLPGDLLALTRTVSPRSARRKAP